MFSTVYFDKADLSFCAADSRADLPAAAATHAAGIIKAVIVQYAQKKGKLDNPNICSCSQAQRGAP